MNEKDLERDGVPINEVSSIHIPDYVDLNPLIPETVRSISIVRGPFSVEAGDAALGGSVFIETKDEEPFSTLSASGGSFDTARGLATFSQAGHGILPFLAYEGYRTAGYRENGQYTFYTDELFFYDDPHQLYKHWGPAIWNSIDHHQATTGMSEATIRLPDLTLHV